MIFYRLAAVYAAGMGMVGTLVGLIAMLSNMDDPSAVGFGLAAMLLTTLYGALLALPCIAMAVALSTRSAQIAETEKTTRFFVPITATAVMLGTFVTVTCGAVLFWLFRS